MAKQEIPVEMVEVVRAEMARIKRGYEMGQASYDGEMIARAVASYKALCESMAAVGLPCPASV